MAASNLTIRIISALVIAPLAIGLTLWSYYSFAFFIAAACLVMAHEWCSITEQNKKSLPLMLSAIAVVFVGMVIHTPEISLAAIIGGIGVRLLSRMINGESSLWAALGIGYIGLAGMSLLLLHNDFGAYFTLWLLVTVWATDIGGYAFGKTIGGAKLAPSISPGKTWAGLFGGMLLAAGVGVFAASFMGGSWLQIAIAGMIIAVVSQIGDLMESKLKRIFGVKDSGSIIPGHGGVLDRLDGVLLAAPACFFIAKALGFEGWL